MAKIYQDIFQENHDSRFYHYSFSCWFYSFASDSITAKLMS